MKVKIILEEGRCGFQISGINKKHLEAYVPFKETKTSKDSLRVMHSCMKAMIYFKKNLKRLKYVQFLVPKMPSFKSREWEVMSSFNQNLADKIGCRIEYTKA